MKVFYREEQVGPSKQASPSEHKAKFVVEDWIRCIGNAVELVSFEPATEQQIARAHHSLFVRGVLSCSEPNGFGNKRPEIAASRLFTSGAMIAAATCSVENFSVAPMSTIP